MERRPILVPGFDCIRGHCRSKGCPGYPKGDSRTHGISGDEWIYTVIHDDGKFALSLTVYTNDLPDSVPPEARTPPTGIPYPYGAHVESCVHDETGIDCKSVGKCRQGSQSCLKAGPFWRRYGTDTFDGQTDEFWEALERFSLYWRDDVEDPGNYEADFGWIDRIRDPYLTRDEFMARFALDQLASLPQNRN